MIIYVDIDGTICNEHPDEKGNKDYTKAEPYEDRIKYFNELYEKGHTITYWTARGIKSGKNWYDFTKKQIEEWGCKYHDLQVGNKPHFDVYICDKSFNSEAWFHHQKLHNGMLK